MLLCMSDKVIIEPRGDSEASWMVGTASASSMPSYQPGEFEHLLAKMEDDPSRKRLAEAMDSVIGRKLN